ncbi:MAG TPA: hypothetical protein HA255_07165, partial [Methanosphaera sp.]|nr:hypothetical protein [Methanosphaera sp.]
MKYIAIFLVLLCCFMGAASAAEDISTDVVSEVADDVAIAEEVSDADSQSDLPDSSLGTNIEEENLRASGTATVSDWTDLKNKSETVGTDYTINLNGPIPIGSTDIQFQNNAVIVGNDNSYITGTATNRIPFRSTSNNALSITFRNVKFQNINCQMLAQLQTTGTNIFDNCTFINITTGTGHDSVIYNNRGIMNVTDCTFTNCTTGYGVITNYRWGTTTGVTLNVKDSTFENNYASSEPGAINNCGILTVINSIFSKNKATMWAGAIHTHTNAYTHIEDSTFNDNVAGYGGTYGWNGGALFSYSRLEVINSVFTGNNVSVLTGGGAIFGYSMGTSTYNITVDSCNFTNNANNYEGGHAGAIGVQNIGYLTVTNSNFINNIADIGQAIHAITKDEPYCTNCTNCSCPNCPNCTNCSHTVSTGVPNCTLINNTYLNHTGSGNTVVIDGQRYTFDYNVFIGSKQDVHYTGIGNDYGDDEDMSELSLYKVSTHSVLGSSILGDWENHDVIYVNRSSPNDSESADIHGTSWEDAYGKSYGLVQAINHINNNGIIYVAEGTYKKFGDGTCVNCTIIGMNRENTIFDGNEFTGGDADTINSISFPSNYGNYAVGVTTYVNITFKNPKVTLRGNKVFINCTFINASITTDQKIYENFILGDPSIYTPYWSNRTYAFNFTNCSFVDYTTEGSVLEAFKTS